MKKTLLIAITLLIATNGNGTDFYVADRTFHTMCEYAVNEVPDEPPYDYTEHTRKATKHILNTMVSTIIDYVDSVGKNQVLYVLDGTGTISAEHQPASIDVIAKNLFDGNILFDYHTAMHDIGTALSAESKFLGINGCMSFEILVAVDCKDNACSCSATGSIKFPENVFKLHEIIPPVTKEALPYKSFVVTQFKLEMARARKHFSN